MSNNLGYNVKDDDGCSDCDDDTIDGQEKTTEDVGETGGSIGRIHGNAIEQKRRLDSIFGKETLPVVDNGKGVKRKTVVGVDGRDREITEEESQSPWFTNKNPTGYGNAEDVARAMVNSRRVREQKREQRKKDEEIVLRALKQAGGQQGMMSIDFKVAMKDHVLLPAEVVERLLPEIAKRLLEEGKK